MKCILMCLMCSILLTLTASCPTYKKKVRICTKINFGDCHEFSLEDDVCYDLRQVSRHIMSIYPYENWFYLFDGRSCTGEQVLVTPETPCQRNLDDCDFGNKTVSIITGTWSQIKKNIFWTLHFLYEFKKLTHRELIPITLATLRKSLRYAA